MKFKFETGKTEDDKKKYSSTAAMPALTDTSVVQKVDGVIEKSLENEATDIHFEPIADEVIVRARIRGAFQKIESFPANMASKIINRIKILAAMDITKTKLPQSGLFKVVTDTVKIDILTDTFPTIRGEKAALNIQYKKGITHKLEDLGMIPTMLDQYKENLNRPNGLIIAAGPPGNGKNTTLYASLQTISSEQKSIATFEPVVKYELPGATQGKPDEKAEFRFEDGVRGIINTRPDILLIGEVQSPEVAKMVVQASFEKRIVLVRMSANNTVNALQNFIDMGIQPFLITSALNAILAQRLVRKICDHCKVAYEPPTQLLQELGLKVGVQFYKGKGCSHCQNMGYSGITGIFELLVMKDELSEMIIARESSRRIREKASQLGMVELKKDGLYKACKGITSIEEVLNAV
jgi:type II secretory ATPase GspE/PulE/Tfp pilus assembly ATPase PilB-like protein